MADMYRARSISLFGHKVSNCLKSWRGICIRETSQDVLDVLKTRKDGVTHMGVNDSQDAHHDPNVVSVLIRYSQCVYNRCAVGACVCLRPCIYAVKNITDVYACTY